MEITAQQIINGRWRENCYIVHEPQGDTLIIDPGGDIERIIEYIAEKQLKVIAILNTHAHYDHIGAVQGLKEKYQVPFLLHSADVKMLKYANLYRKFFDGEDPVPIPTLDRYLDQAENPMQLGRFSIQVLATPGHTPGSVCFLLAGHLFTGDTLLRGKVGRVDLPAGDPSLLAASLKQLSRLPAEITLYPGHGRTSTLERELTSNEEFLRAIRDSS